MEEAAPRRDNGAIPVANQGPSFSNERRPNPIDTKQRLRELYDAIAWTRPSPPRAVPAIEIPINGNNVAASLCKGRCDIAHPDVIDRCFDDFDIEPTKPRIGFSERGCWRQQANHLRLSH